MVAYNIVESRYISRIEKLQSKTPELRTVDFILVSLSLPSIILFDSILSLALSRNHAEALTQD